MQLLPAGRCTIDGELGRRIRANVHGLITAKDEEALLAGFRSRPGIHPWIGEHVGKWIHAACLTVGSGADPALERKLERVVGGLIASQESDGYLGTYGPAERWSGWDVWVHKYVLIGLLAYWDLRADERALDAARHVGDLLRRTFGDDIAALNSTRVSTHRGMAAGSCLEAVVQLQRASGEERFLELARAMAANLECEGGPRLVPALLEHGSVARAANAKAYEMLSCLNGLLQLHEIDPTPRYLTAAESAWEDICAHHLYPTGGLSYAEFFHSGELRPEAGQVSETCVVVTWLQLNEHLLRLTGRRACLDELQRSTYNALLGAQRPDGAAFCYFTPLAGHKPYTGEINCCTSSGARGLALAQRWFAAAGASAVEFLSFAPGRAELEIEGRAARLVATGDFTLGEPCQLSLEGIAGLDIELRVRQPATGGIELRTADRDLSIQDGPGYLAVRSGGRERVDLELRWEASVERIAGSGLQCGRAILRKGPWILSVDEGLQGREDAARNTLADLAASEGWKRTPTLAIPYLESRAGIRLCPFACAGWSGSRYLTSVPLEAHSTPVARGSASAPGIRVGALDSGDPDVCWSAGGDAVWFMLEWERAIEISRLEFRQGWMAWDDLPFHRDAHGPRFEVRADPDGDWIPLGNLRNYPERVHPVVDQPPHILPGSPFTIEFPPRRIRAARVIGRGSGRPVHCAGLLAR